MASADAMFSRFGNRVSRPGSSSVRGPRTAQLSFHQGEIHDVDEFTNTVHWQFNGDDTVIPGIRYMHAYSPTNPPEAGHAAYGFMNGTSFVVAGRLLVPDSTVILP